MGAHTHRGMLPALPLLSRPLSYPSPQQPHAMACRESLLEQLQRPPDGETLRIMVATDNHVGYNVR